MVDRWVWCCSLIGLLLFTKSSTVHWYLVHCSQRSLNVRKCVFSYCSQTDTRSCTIWKVFFIYPIYSTTSILTIHLGGVIQLYILVTDSLHKMGYFSAQHVDEEASFISKCNPSNNRSVSKLNILYYMCQQEHWKSNTYWKLTNEWLVLLATILHC